MASEGFALLPLTIVQCRHKHSCDLATRKQFLRPYRETHLSDVMMGQMAIDQGAGR